MNINDPWVIINGFQGERRTWTHELQEAAYKIAFGKLVVAVHEGCAIDAETLAQLVPPKKPPHVASGCAEEGGEDPDRWIIFVSSHDVIPAGVIARMSGFMPRGGVTVVTWDNLSLEYSRAVCAAAGVANCRFMLMDDLGANHHHAYSKAFMFGGSVHELLDEPALSECLQLVHDCLRPRGMAFIQTAPLTRFCKQFLPLHPCGYLDITVTELAHPQVVWHEQVGLMQDNTRVAFENEMRLAKWTHADIVRVAGGRFQRVRDLPNLRQPDGFSWLALQRA